MFTTFFQVTVLVLVAEPSGCKPGLLGSRLFTTLYFFRKIVDIERFALRSAILHERQNYLGGGGCLGGSEKNRGTVITSLQLAFRRRDRNFTPFTIHYLRNSAGDEKHARRIWHLFRVFTNIFFRNSDFIQFLGHSSKLNRQTCTGETFSLSKR